MKIQARSEKNGLSWYNTVKEAMEAADKDDTIHTISFDVGNERVVLRKNWNPTNFWGASIDTNYTQDDAPRRNYRGRERRRAELKFDSTGKVIP